jgi:hypothetical protein
VDGGLALFTFDANTGATRTGTLTIAGLPLVVTQAGNGYTAINTTTTLASELDRPFGVAVDSSGNVYIAESDFNFTSITEWCAATQTYSGVGYGLYLPEGAAVDRLGNVFIADTGNHAIKEWSPATQSITTLVSAGLLTPSAVAVDSYGNVYIADYSNCVIKECCAATHFVSTLVPCGCPNGVAVDGCGNVYIAGDEVMEWSATTQTTSTLFSGVSASGVAVDGSGNVYIAGSEIMEWSPARQAVSTLVNSGLKSPCGVAVDASGNVYFSDFGNCVVKELPHAYLSATVVFEGSAAGSDQVQLLSLSPNLTGIFAPISDQSWLTINSVSGGVINFSFTAYTGQNSRIAHITVLGQQITVMQISPSLGTYSLLEGPSSGTDSVIVSWGGSWTASSNAFWLHTTTSGTGNGLAIFSIDANTGATRAATLTIAGMTLTVTQAGSTYTAANPTTMLVGSGLNYPYGVAVDSGGNVYIADAHNNAIKVWSATAQTVSTLVSSGLSSPAGVAVDSLGNVYIADSGNNAIKKLSAGTQTVTTLVSIQSPSGVAVDSSGNVYFTDANNSLMEWSAAIQATGPLVNSGLEYPEGVAVDSSGNVYIIDNGAIKEWSAETRTVSTLLNYGVCGVAVDGSGNIYFSGGGNVDKRLAATMAFSWASSGTNNSLGVAVDGSGNLYFSDNISQTVMEVPNAFVSTAPISEPFAGGSDQLLPVLPTTANLTGVYTPTSDQPWLTLGTIANGVINFSFTVNPNTTSRTAHITVLGKQIALTQAGKGLLTVTAESLSATYGQAVPTLLYTITGFQNGDSSSVITGTPNLSTTASTGSPVGSYSISVDVSGMSAANYLFTGVSGTLTINPAALAVTATAQSMVYGTSIQSFTYTYTGLVNGDASAAFTGGLTTTPGTVSAAGTYSIIQGTLAATGNYTIGTFTGANLAVTPASLAVTATAQGKVYGAANPSLSYTYAGLVNGDTAATFTGALATASGASSPVGTYSITQGALTATGNYTIGSFTGANLTVTPASLAVTATAQTKVYGSANPSLTFTYTGLLNGDTSATFTGALATTATTASGVGAYPITQNNLEATGNYTIGTFIGANLTVTPAVLIVTADQQNEVYGGAMPSLTYSISGFQNGDDASVITGVPVLTTVANTSAVGGYTINIDVSGMSAANYTFVGVSGILTINPASLAVTATVQTIAYGTNPVLTYTYTGLVNGDTAASFTGALATTVTSSSVVGTYSIMQGTLEATGNYTIGTFTGANLTVTQASLSVTATAQSKVYGVANPSLTYSYTGLVNGDTFATFTGTLATTATTASAVGTYLITQNNLAATGNYTIGTFTGANLTVTQASLAVTATAQSKVYGVANSVLTYTYTGLVNGDPSATFTGALTTTATTASSVGTYPITQNTLAATGNYTIGTFTGANLTVTPASLAVTVTAQSKVYGTADPALTYTYTGLVNDDTFATFTGTLATTATTASSVGTYPISQNTLAATGNYTIGTFTGANLTVTQATLTVTANNQSKTYGAANPSLTYIISGYQNGDTSSVITGTPSLSTTAGIGSSAGSFPISISVNGMSATNYTFSGVAGTLTINPAALAITATTQSKVYGMANPSLTYTYMGLVNGDASATFTGALATTATTASAVGTYPISEGTLAATGNYSIGAFSGANLTVTSAPLAVTATAQSKVYGTVNPALTFTYTGLVNGDTSAIFTGALATMATDASGVGTYPITQNNLAATGNYSIGTFTGANLTITQAQPVITWNNPSAITYPTALSATQLNATASTPGSFAYTPLLGTVLSPGSQTLSATFTPTDATDYTVATVSVTLTVNASITFIVGPTAAPNPAGLSTYGVGQTISFSSSATDGTDALTYTWTFGDGGTGTGANPTHSYTQAGTYSVTVTATDAFGNSLSTTITVIVAAPIVGTGTDSTGTGYSDSFLAATGLVSSQPATADAVQTLAVPSMSIKLDFTKPGNDSISMNGALAIPAGFTVKGQLVAIDIGGVMASFTLDANGASTPKSNNLFEVGVKSTKGVVKTQTAKYAVKLTKGSFATALGLAKGATSKPTTTSATSPVTVIFNGAILQNNVKLSYKATSKNGAATTAK